MSVKKIGKEAFVNFIDSLIKTEKVIGVQAKGERFDFAMLASAKELRLDYDVTLLPPKRFFQPTSEVLLTFEMEGKYKSKFEDERFILLGVHPYDVAAISQMDKLFSKDYYDDHYMKRRNNATIIACDVVTASENVFASSMGTATVSTGYDILLTDVGDAYIAEAATEKGKGLLAKMKAAVEADKKDLEKRERIQQENRERLNKHKLKCRPSEIPALLDKAYKHPVWEEMAKTCFSCGSCNMVCPTCYCFNVQDNFNWDLKSGQRQRIWDGCLLDGFTKVAGGHEFRANRADRFRHRFYRKGKYVPEKIGGEISCVGCGRCVGACLPDIANPVKVYNRLVDEIK
jgi:sulfhydrogenase subunit beta (sulfur reductase)